MLNLSHAIKLCARHVHHADVQCATEYGESGYDNPPTGILFANWNDCPRWLQDGLERRGFALEWSDEWVQTDAGKAYRCQRNSYGWRQSFVIFDDCTIIGHDEIKNDPSLQDEYVEKYLLNNPKRACTFDLDFAAMGFTQFNGTFESGWHPGQNDDPKEVLKRIQAELPNHDVVFSLDSSSQFDIAWTAWTRPQA
jgi:hypothetical protein